MVNKFEKSLLLCPDHYSLAGVFSEILKNLSGETYSINIRRFAGTFDLRIDTQIFRFPHTLRSKWEAYFLGRLNKAFLDYYHELLPDLVMVYNSEFLSPETCEIMKEKSKLIFFLGDSPFFTKGNNYYLAILKYADLILAPDTFWIKQLNITGLTNTMFFVPGINREMYFELAEEEIDSDIPASEVLYTGMSYPDSWGYKKALFMNQFVNFNLKIYGSRHWKKWFKYFPELRSKFTESGFIPVKRLNAMMNRSRIIPVDGNPGILNGFHIRLLEALGSGALPLIEYRRDLDHEVFKQATTSLPLVKDYRDAGDLAAYYLKNENERNELTRTLKQYIIKEYSAGENAARIAEALKAR
jgi:glycosyltransferase involved in cell wall biosynthesis